MKLRAMTWMGLILLSGLPAWADWTFTSGTTTSGGNSVSATAVFHIVNSSTIDLSLTNSSTVINIGTVLDGISFTVGGTNSLSLGNVTPTTTTMNGANTAGVAGGFIDCTTSTNKVNDCHSVSAFEDYPDSTTLSSPYDWTVSSAYLAAAGNGSWKPAGIVNSSIDGHLDGLRDTEHNDYLFGPVTFQLTDADNTNLISGISNVTFDWGTVPDTTSGTLIPDAVPEPASVTLLGSLLFGLGFAFRKKVHRA